MANTMQEIYDMEERLADLDRAGKALHDRIFANGREGAIRWLIDHKMYLPPEEVAKFESGEYETWQDYCDAMEKL